MNERRTTFIGVTRLICFICVTWLICLICVSHTWMSHDTLMNERMNDFHWFDKTHVPDMCDMTYMCNMRVAHMDESCHTYEWKNERLSLVWQDSYVWHDSYVSYASRTYGWVMPHENLLGTRRVSNPSTIIEPDSLKIGFLVLIQNAGFVRDNGTN